MIPVRHQGRSNLPHGSIPSERNHGEAKGSDRGVSGLNILQAGQAKASPHSVASAQAERVWEHQMFQEHISSWITLLPKGRTY